MMDRIREFIEYLDTLEFRPLDEQFLRELWPTIVEVVRNPASNQPAAIALFLIAVTLILIIGIAVEVLIARFSGDDEDEYETIVIPAGGDGEPVAVTRIDAPPTPKDTLRWHRSLLWGLGGALVLLLAVGAGSQSRSLCLSCHEGIPHTVTVEADAHQSVPCVRCHEPAGVLRSFTLAVPARLGHVAIGLFESDGKLGYGLVVGKACRNCHSDDIEGVVEVSNRGLLVSHAEPLEAGALCLDCHMLNEDARIGQATKGMATCLRCHDGGEADVECATCHVGDVSQAVLFSLETIARQMIGQPNCYTCHETESCDSCHGVRLPHPPNYQWYHMYDAAADLWSNAGATCYNCHTDERNSCYQAGCHGAPLRYHYPNDPTFPRTHGNPGAYPRGDVTIDCNDCHVYAGTFDNPCQMCHQP